MKNILLDKKGSVGVYVAMFTAAALGGGALAIDYGRGALLKSQMQSAADAAALAAVVHLDGKPQAMARAEAVARNAAENSSSVTGNGDDADLSVDAVKFYSSYSPTIVAAADDLDAKFIEVTMTGQTINYFFAPILKIFDSNPVTEQTLVARAVAGAMPHICHAPPPDDVRPFRDGSGGRSDPSCKFRKTGPIEGITGRQCHLGAR